MKPIRILNQSNINKAFFRMDKRIKALEAQLGGNAAETISDAPVIEDAPITVDAVQPFSYLECDDLDQLKAFADEKGVDYDARATVSSLQKKITTKLGVAE